MTAKLPTPQEPVTRVSGKDWKLAKLPANRTHLPRGVKTSFEIRKAKSKQVDIARNLAKAMKDEKNDEKRRKRETTEERKRIREEKERIEAHQSKMSANKLKRLKKKAGNLKGR
ncbi:hypothetical protein BGW38_000253 [Lunasporangiospora selenospora]|uniref:rRNA-processing protein n=1 Tax=Lunasporangiospora selenospora TaxID=979761 RepID=A0A9P6FVL7_9FUNG|nr:hypothetical protein BGW38_000253 [Lunasporangiospora selenospora]